MSWGYSDKEDPRIAEAELSRSERYVDDWECDRLDRQEERRIYGD